MRQNLKTNNINKPELLAPAGNITTFYAVINAGADAIYMAGSRFGARAYADNFSDEEIIRCICYAHLFDKKIYLTINTLTREQELPDLISFLKPLYEAGLDGVIVQDIGVLKAVGEAYPDLLLHASTQMTITSSNGANLLKELNVSRVVPARELSLDEIKNIKKNTGLELECFIHGAMCYCYSGKCLFSSVVGKRSGNRGRCAQPCRLPYKIDSKLKLQSKNDDEIYPLSLKDMCTIELIPELIQSGIDSFKIEGRMKKPEYAAGVTSIYRKYIDLYYSNNEYKVSKEDLKLLNNLYIRSQISDGYYHRTNGADMVTLSSPSYNGCSDEVINKIKEKYVNENAKLKKQICFYAEFNEGSEACLTAICDDISVVIKGDLVSTANNRPISASDVEKSLSKLGDSNFILDKNTDLSASIFVSDNAYYNLKGINDLRRRAIAQIEKEIIEANGYKSNKDSKEIEINTVIPRTDSLLSTSKFSIAINSLDQLNAAITYLVDNNKRARIYISESLLLCKYDEILEIIKKSSFDYFIKLTQIRRSKTYKFYNLIDTAIESKLFKGLVVSNYEDLEYIKKYNHINIITDSMLYSWNTKSIEYFDKYADIIGLPVEISSKGIKELCVNNTYTSFEFMVYGRIPLMVTANCIYKTCGKCQINFDEKLHQTSLKDRTGRIIPVVADCNFCLNYLYNNVPTTIYKNLTTYPSNISFNLTFTTEDKTETLKVLDFYYSEAKTPDWEYTKAFENQSTE